MIKNLHIENIALISKLDIAFDNGLTVLSGETGAGKSIIIDSLSFVLGERADKTLIKYGQERAFVEVAFEIDTNSRTYALLSELGFEQDTIIVINRTLTITGKNECRVNGRICPTTLLRQITATLVDIFGQSQHLNLLKVDNHIKVLDDYQRDDTLKNQLALCYNDYKDIKKQLAMFGGSDSERERLMDILRFQIDEIESAKLSAKEENELLEIRSRVLNIEKIASGVGTALDELTNGENNAVTQIATATNAIAMLTTYDHEISDIYDRLATIRIDLDDIVANLEKIMQDTDYNPNEIDRMEERLERIKTLKKKYGGTIDDVVTFCKNAKAQYENLVNASELIDQFSAKQKAIIAKMYDLSQQLSIQRLQTAQKLKIDIERQLSDLGMPGTTFDVQFAEQPTIEEYSRLVSPNGYDKIEFLLSANMGEPLKPLSKVISGGEMSRFMLAIKNITAHIENIPTMVFDEIDIGISGSMAQMVAIKLANVSHDYQCVVITHLPQISAMADYNMLITKGEINGRTESTLQILDESGKVQEIARLMGGNNLGEYSALHAKEMIAWADKIKSNIKS